MSGSAKWAIAFPSLLMPVRTRSWRNCGAFSRTSRGDADDDLTVSAIGFGAGALAAYGDVDDAESLATLNRCLDLGVTFIDTANVYGGGSNERLIAKLLADRRDEVTLATKFGVVGNPADRAAEIILRLKRSSAEGRKPDAGSR